MAKFKEFCEIDLQLKDLTVKGHIWQIKRFLDSVSKAPDEIDTADVRNYLLRFKDKQAPTYANVLKSLRVFFRDFVNKGEVVSSFKFPEISIELKIVPDKRQLQEFYKALETPQERTIFLMFATTGLRKHELLGVRLKDINLEKRMILPQNDGSRTKRTWMTFFNEESERLLIEYLDSNGLTPESRLFPSGRSIELAFKKAEKETAIRITPQVLREWFACEMGRLGVGDRYVDAFCGRVPNSVLARHYTDFSPDRLKEIYDKAGIKVLS